MPWNYDANHPFAGIAEKLQRSEQNILDLHSEIDLFITNGQYPVIPHPEDKTFQEATEYHKTKMIPLRFGVLAGEVVHHLRSCLDHIVWHFSDDASRAKPRSIEFPIFEVKPSNKKEIETYERKVKGISNANVLRMIEESQPYRAGSDIADHRLLIIHNMDIIDKHRELTIVDSSVNISFPVDIPELGEKIRLYHEGKLSPAEDVALSRAIKDYGKASPGVAFRQFGKWKVYRTF
jgi:hypothetical protein